MHEYFTYGGYEKRIQIYSAVDWLLNIWRRYSNFCNKVVYTIHKNAYQKYISYSQEYLAHA